MTPRSPVCTGALAAALVAVLVAMLAGCGLDATDRPVPVTLPGTGDAATTGTPPGRGEPIPVYLVRDQRLVAVLRRGDDVTDALAAVIAGPTAVETAGGVSTALGPGPITVRPDGDARTAVLEVTDGFATLAGASQLLAVGQVVWTATGVCCAERVEVLLEGRPLPLPTDDGLVRRPVTRDDYRSIAPA